MPDLVPEVHWKEGMLLQPHHLQLLQRYVRGMTAYIAGMRPFSYGIKALEISRDSVTNWVLRLKTCDLVMPDGTVLIMGQTAIIHPVEFRHLKREGTNLEVWIGVPFSRDDMPNLSDSDSAGGDEAFSRRYVADAIPQQDENSGRNEVSVEVRRINARIFVGNKPREGFATLKIAELEKIVTVVPEESRYELSDEFVPACLHVEASSQIIDTLLALRDSLEDKNGDLLTELKGNTEALSGLDKTTDPGMLLKLQATNAILPLMHQIAAQPSLHPFEVYLQLTRLIGELSIFSPDWTPPRLMVYDHENPLAAFRDLRGRWIGLLGQAIDNRFRQSEFKPVSGSEGVVEARIPREYLAKDVRLFIAVEPKQDLASMFKNCHTILAAPEDLPEDPNRVRWPFIELDPDPENKAPARLRDNAGRDYQPIKREGEFWKNARERRTVRLVGAGVAPGSTFYLCATNVGPAAPAESSEEVDLD